MDRQSRLQSDNTLSPAHTQLSLSPLRFILIFKSNFHKKENPLPISLSKLFDFFASLLRNNRMHNWFCSLLLLLLLLAIFSLRLVQFLHLWTYLHAFSTSDLFCVDCVPESLISVRDPSFWIRFHRDLSPTSESINFPDLD